MDRFGMQFLEDPDFDPDQFYRPDPEGNGKADLRVVLAEEKSPPPGPVSAILTILGFVGQSVILIWLTALVVYFFLFVIGAV